MTKREALALALPWPPSVNAAYRSIGRGRVIKSKVARDYFKNISDLIAVSRIDTFGTARLRVIVDCYPPDKRERDLDNIGKVLLDTLQNSGLFLRDSQIDDLRFVRRQSEKPGYVQVTIEEL